MEDIDSLAVVFTPVWDRKKGMLYRSESMVLDKIASANVNCDERAVLSFAERIDSRDRRPLEYPLRLCFPNNEKSSQWRKVQLVCNNRVTERAIMLHTKDMLQVECMTDDVVPDSSNLDLELNPGDRDAQIGDSVAAAILDSTARCLAPAERTTLIILDGGPKTGDWSRAAMRLRPSLTMGLYYYAVGSGDETEYANKSTQELAMELYLDDTLNVPGFTPFEFPVRQHCQDSTSKPSNLRAGC